MTRQIALFDTNAGILQWIGKAESHEDAIRAHIQDVGFADEVRYAFRAVDVTDAQAKALCAWHECGAESPDYPADIDKGVVYEDAEVREMLGKDAGPVTLSAG